MKLHDVELSEIAPFFDSLGCEKELAMMSVESAMACSFLAGIRTNGELVGLTGIRMQYGFIPNLFVVVKEKYQGMGVGNKLLEKNLSFAKQNYNFLTLATRDTKEYESALHLYEKHNFKYFRRQGRHVRMYIPFTKKGEIVGRFLSPIYLFLVALRERTNL